MTIHVYRGHDDGRDYVRPLDLLAPELHSRVRYSDDAIVLLEGRWQDCVAGLPVVDAVITDPPYGERTHTGQRHGRKDPGYSPDSCLSGRGLPYAHLSSADAEALAASLSDRCSGWFCAFTSHDLLPAYSASLEAAGRYVFAPLACVQSGMNVRLAGDGPSNWTCWLVVSRPRSLRAWGALPGAYVVGQDQDRKRGVAFVGGKPTDLMRAIVRDYSRPGDLVLDPCCGGGTTALACRLEGRRCITIECDPNTVEIARRRMELLPTETAKGQRALFGDAP